MAESLNDTELSVQEVCVLPISFTQENFKENIWKKVQLSMYPDKTSTTQLETDEVTKVYEEVNRLISDWGVSHQFPSYFNEG